MEATKQKRPTGMTILLVLSLIYACCFIFMSFCMFVTAPAMEAIVQNNQLEQYLAPYSTVLNDEQMDNMKVNLMHITQIDAKFWLFNSILYVGSLVGVIRMFKGNKVGFHIYSIAKFLILINFSIFLYPIQPHSGFFSDLLLTMILIWLYYLYFKRMEKTSNTTTNE